MPSEKASTAFSRYRHSCPNHIALPTPRGVNALAIETGTPLARCRLKTPKQWGDVDHLAVRWLLSGGSPLVLGHCSADCPLRPQFCACGHTKLSHGLHGRNHTYCGVVNCACEDFTE